MTREELLSSKEYWVSCIQLDLFTKVKEYLDQHDLTQTALAQQLNVSKGYISQVLNGDFDHKLSKLVEFALASGQVPLVFFVDKDTYIRSDANDMYYMPMPVKRPANMEYTTNERGEVAVACVVEPNIADKRKGKQ